MEEENASREKKILAIVDQELQDGRHAAAAVKQLAERMLFSEKGFLPGDVEKDYEFELALGNETVTSSVDFLVSVDGAKAMIIKCCAGSLSSRERQAVAAARLVGERAVPVAVVMDPIHAETLDAVTGKLMGEGFESVPTKAQLGEILSAFQPEKQPAERLEKEKRILLAFDAIGCIIPRGTNGGVSIG